jgi:hypothetical protein
MLAVLPDFRTGFFPSLAPKRLLRYNSIRERANCLGAWQNAPGLISYIYRGGNDSVDEQKPDTRLWMGGVEVQFVGWTNFGLVYTRVGSMQTLANLTKSTVRRLLQDGTLRIEGYCPDWADPDLFADDELAAPKPSTRTESTESESASESNSKPDTESPEDADTPDP